MIDGQKAVDPGFDSRFNSRRFQLFVAEIGQAAKFHGGAFQVVQARLQLLRVAFRYGAGESRLSLLGQALFQRFHAFYTRFDVVQRRLQHNF